MPIDTAKLTFKKECFAIEGTLYTSRFFQIQWMNLSSSRENELKTFIQVYSLDYQDSHLLLVHFVDISRPP